MALAALFRSSMRAFSNTGRLVRRQSLFKITVIICCALTLFLGLGAIFYQGFNFLHDLGGAGLMVIHRLFALFFFGLSIMLVFSSVATSYTTLYRSSEVPSLLVRPVSLGALAIYKSAEAAVYSSWAFFFMILPFIGAYALHEKLSPLFAVWTLFFSVPFVLLCCAIGTVVCMILVRCLPSGRALYIVLGGLALAFLAVCWRIATSGDPSSDDTTLILTRLIPGVRISSEPLLPSWWIAEGIMALARGAWGRGLMLWLLTVSTVLVLGVIIDGLGRAIFYDGWLKGLVSMRRSGRTSVLLSWIERVLLAGSGRSRALMRKDIRMFVRDPAQWTQVLVFFGLLAIYFLNLRQFRYHLLEPEWRNMIVFLNMFSVSAVVCSLSARFVYPQMSMEGHSFWIVGLSPVPMKKFVYAKFRLAGSLLAVVTIGLTGLSTQMLDVSPGVQWVAGLAACCICVVVTALAVGLGAIFADLNERNPAAIVSSFGGTLNLVLSMVFTFAVLLPFAALVHQHTMGRISTVIFERSISLGIVILLVATWLCAWTPLRLGIRNLAEREY